MLQKVHYWREEKMQYGVGLVHVRDGYWTEDRIRADVVGHDLLKKFKGINCITVVNEMSGWDFIRQFGGYNDRDGMFCYRVLEDGSIVREV